ncbi:MAG: DegT/DnrJ/EryC1/StrS aminotransferase family protein, partial [bacterium]
CGTKKAIVLSNGTMALELALVGLGLQPGDEIVTTPRTFVATASAFVIHGIKPVFADVDRDSGNITPESVEKVLTPKTKAIVPVHIGGWPCDMPGFMSLASSKGIAVIEDCAQANGAAIGGKSIGSFGQVNAWSFCQDKIVTTGGEGGMVTTDDEEMWSRMWSYKDHGKDFSAVYERSHPIGFRWVHEHFGTNWRLTEPQSAMGRIQLRRMAEWQAARTANAQLLIERFSACPALRTPVPTGGLVNAWYRLYTYIRPEALRDGWTRERIMEECAARGLNLMVGSCSEIYLEKAYMDAGLAPAERLPVARELGDTSLAFVTH